MAAEASSAVNQAVINCFEAPLIEHVMIATVDNDSDVFIFHRLPPEQKRES